MRGLLLALLAGCGDAPCPAGSARDPGTGLCTLLPDDTGDAGGAVVYSDCPADTGRFEDPVAVDASLTWASWGDGFFATYCTSCHSVGTPDRRGAPEGVDFDSEADVIAWGARVRARVLDAGTMPLGGGVIDEDLLLLDRYLCRLGVAP